MLVLACSVGVFACEGEEMMGGVLGAVKYLKSPAVGSLGLASVSGGVMVPGCCAVAQ